MGKRFRHEKTATVLAQPEQAKKETTVRRTALGLQSEIYTQRILQKQYSTAIESSTAQPQLPSTGDTILPNQVDNLLQHRILLRIDKSDRKGLRNKLADILVNVVSATRSDMIIHKYILEAIKNHFDIKNQIRKINNKF